MSMTNVRTLFIGAMALALVGCVTPPKEPDYSATWPEPPPAPETGNGAIYQVGHDIALFENSVARRVGDTLTIRLSERTNASKSSSTSSSKSTLVDMPGPTIAVRPVNAHKIVILIMMVDNIKMIDLVDIRYIITRIQYNHN